MCLILFAYKSHPKYQLILAANRDEYYERPTAQLAYWQDHPQVLAGRDLQAMGTWMGVTQGGRLAAVTNYREPSIHNPDALSRGVLVTDFLTNNMPPDDYLKKIQSNADQYNGFNLLVGDSTGLHYYSNRGHRIAPLSSGIYGLSNHLLDTDWPKVRRGKKRLAAMTRSDGDITIEKVCRLLKNQNNAAADQLPDTGVGFEWETLLAPIFITSATYGTRSSSILLIDNDGNIRLGEYTWRQGQSEPRLLDKKQFDLTITPANAKINSVSP